MNTLKFKLKNQQVYKSSELILKRLTRSRIILPVLVLLACLVISYISWNIADANRKNELRSYFEFRARDVNDRIKHRIVEYQTILRSTRGLFNASTNVNRAEFRDFINSLSLEKNYPGIQGVGFSLIVPSEQIKKHITTIRNEGFTKYKIWPEGNRETCTSIIYLEPFRDLNLRAFGYDMYSEPVRREAMATSRDLNKTVISTKVNLVQETGKEVQAGFLIYLPVYRYGTQNTSLTERRTNIVGWVYSPFRMGDFMEGVLGERSADLAIEIYDGKNILNETKMYSSVTQPTGIHQPLVIKKTIEFNNHEWTVLVKYTPKLESRMGYNTAGMILIVGISLSILLAIITWLLVNKRMRTIIADTERKIAENSLKKLQEEQQILLDNIPAWIFYKDVSNRIIRVNKTFADAMGMSIEQLEGKSLFDIFPNEQAEVFGKDDKEVMVTGKSKVNIIKQMKSPKDNLWIQTAKIPYRDIQGNIVGLIVFSLDITERKRAEESLRESHQIIEEIINAIPVRVFWKDRNLTYLGCNNIFAQDAGFTNPKEIIGKDDFQMGWRDQAELYRDDDFSVIETGRPKLLIEEPQTTPEGKTITLLTSKIPLRDPTDKIVGILGTYMDITERKQMESALKTSEERFRTAAENLTDVVYEWDLKDKLDWYGDIDSITGYEQGVFPRTIEGWEALIHPDDKHRIITALENHIKGEAPYNTEYRIKRSDGGWRWWSARGTALRNEQGREYKMIGSITDITEQKDIQNKIKFDADLLSHVGQAVIATDLQGNVIYWNNAAEDIYGWSSAEAMGQNIYDLTPTEVTKKLAKEIMKELSEGNSWSGEFLVKRKDGSIFPAYITDSPIIDSDGLLTGIIGVSNDITERKQTEEEIKKSHEELVKINAEKDKFFSIIAHDLRSPFNGFLNLTALMADTTEKISLDEFAEYSKMINKTARNLYMLLDNLLEWAQIQKGNINFTPKNSDLSSMVSQCIDTIYQSALQKRIAIINEITNPQKVFADEKSINTVLRNLLSNAVKFTRMDGKIKVKSRRSDDGTIQVLIEDNGVGISDDDVKKLFRIEEKVSSLGTEGEPSTGLGLLLCKEFVEMHGQKIWVESEKNKGSTFCFTLKEGNGYETK
jgi:PAS domain S-box-containing protein